MGSIDIVIIGLIVLSGLFALYRGLVRELLTLVTWALAVLCGFFGMYVFRPLTMKFISNEQIADAVTAVVVAIVVLVICTLITDKINKGLRKSALSGLDRTLGFLFGLLRAVIVVIGVYFFCVFAVSHKNMARYEKKNLLLPYLAELVPIVESMLPDSWMDTLRTIQSDTPPSQNKTDLDQVDIKEKPNQTETVSVSYDLKDLKSMDSLIEEIE